MKSPETPPREKNWGAIGPGTRLFARHAIALGAVLLAFLSHQKLNRLVGGDLPTYITFYPTVMFVALLAGFWPGFLATIAAALLAACFILPPPGLAIERLQDAASLPLFISMGMLMSLLAELYRRSRDRMEEMVAARTAELSRANERLTCEIAERRQAEAALRESEEQLKQAQAIAHLGSWVLDLESGQLHWSDEVFRIFGLEPQEFDASYQAFLEVVHPDDRAAVDAAYSRSLEEGKDTYEIEHRVVRSSDGAIRIVHEKCEHFRDAAGRIVRSIGMVHDITEQKRAEESLLLSEQRYQTLAAATFEGIAVSEDGRFIDVNDQLARLLGYAPDELIGLNVADLLPAEDRDWVLANIISGTPSRHDHELIRKDGSRCKVEVHGRTIRQQGRKIRLTAFHDITERRRYEEDLLRAREAAESASRTKDEFLANISHEIRTPMTGVLGMLQVVLDGELDPQQREYLGIVQSSAEALLRLLNDILEFSRIEAGAITFVDEPFAIEWGVRGVLDLFTLEAQRKGLGLALEIAPGTPDGVIGDEGRIRQVITNLLGNAVKFTERGKVTLHISAGKCLAGGRREITFAIADTGIGIPAGKQDLLFRAFSQVDGSSTRRHGGTGLGLAISKRIVEQMGGAISCSSAEGEGTTFAFTIPVGEIGATPSADFTSPMTGEEERIAFSLAAATPVRLLIAEDDRVIRDMLELSLQGKGYQLDSAADGREAVALWEQGSHALILMDVQMPLLDGYEATRLIRYKERELGRQRTPIVALTAHAYPEDEARCLAAGMDAYLAKPIEFTRLHRLVAELTRDRFSP